MVSMGKSLLARVPTRAKLGVPVAAGLLAAACGSAAASQSSGSQPPGSASGSTTGTVIMAHPGSGGAFLTSGGRSVYLWAADGMNKSNCSGACAGAWPPVMAHGKLTASNGAKPSDLGTIARPGGGSQVTYDGHPLYFFAGDSGPGQTNGQASDSFGARWWLVASAGTKITTADTATSAGGASPKAPASSSGSSAGGSWG
jgi:predicted lipoprotein with Yx(FWY)xxD motif